MAAAAAKIETENQSCDGRESYFGKLKYLLACLQVVFVAPEVSPTGQHHEADNNEQDVTAEREQVSLSYNAGAELPASLIRFEKNTQPIFGRTIRGGRVGSGIGHEAPSKVIRLIIRR